MRYESCRKNLGASVIGMKKLKRVEGGVSRNKDT